MHVLVVKTSSMGDVLHTLPALTDAQAAYPGIRFDWVVEESFRQIPSWHPAVDTVIPVAFRTWRKHPARWFGSDTRALVRSLRSRYYTHIIDAQGLMKSALISRLARGPRYGYSFDTVRERPAAAAYSHHMVVPRGLHAVRRVRDLFAASLGYCHNNTPPDYGIDVSRFSSVGHSQNRYLVFVHVSSWPSKCWPGQFWQELIKLATAARYRVRLPWGTELERGQAMAMAHNHPGAEVMPAMELDQLAAALAQATAVVSVDTGLAHLAAAVGTPNVTIYGATDPGLTGTAGFGQHHLSASFPCSPCLSKRCTYTELSAVKPACYATVSPQQVWSTLQPYIDQGQR